MEKVFDLLESHDEVWERNSDGDVWALNWDKAKALLTENGIKGTDGKLACAADYYGVDIY